jgi:hypothetical protein
MIVGFAGRIGSGKSTAAFEMCKVGGFQRVRFAGPLKKMMAALGLTTAQIDGNEKELPCELLCGKSPRQAMQTIGTEWGRNLVGGQLWVNAWKHAVMRLPAHVRVVADDVRFANEAEAIREMGGVVVRIDREVTASSNSNHASEAFEFDVDHVIANTGTEEFFINQVKMMVAGMLAGNKTQEAA